MCWVWWGNLLAEANVKTPLDKSALWREINWKNIQITYAWQFNYLRCNNEYHFAREYSNRHRFFVLPFQRKYRSKPCETTSSVFIWNQKMAQKSGIDFCLPNSPTIQFSTHPLCGDRALSDLYIFTMKRFVVITQLASKHTFSLDFW